VVAAGAATAHEVRARRLPLAQLLHARYHGGECRWRSCTTRIMHAATAAHAECNKTDARNGLDTTATIQAAGAACPRAHAVRTCTDAPTQACINAHTDIHTHTHTRTHTHTHTHTLARMHAGTQAAGAASAHTLTLANSIMHAFSHTSTHKHGCTDARTHVYAQTYTHTHNCTYKHMRTRRNAPAAGAAFSAACMRMHTRHNASAAGAACSAAAACVVFSHDIDRFPQCGEADGSTPAGARTGRRRSQA